MTAENILLISIFAQKDKYESAKQLESKFETALKSVKEVRIDIFDHIPIGVPLGPLEDIYNLSGEKVTIQMSNQNEATLLIPYKIGQIDSGISNMEFHCEIIRNKNDTSALNLKAIAIYLGEVNQDGIDIDDYKTAEELDAYLTKKDFHKINHVMVRPDSQFRKDFDFINPGVTYLIGPNGHFCNWTTDWEKIGFDANYI